MKKLKPYQKIEVEWLDSIHQSGWTYCDRIEDQDLRCVTCGYFIKEDDNSISIIQSYRVLVLQDGSRSIDSIMNIPKKSILKQTPLK